MSRRDAEGRRSTKVLRRRRSKCKAVSILSCRRATVRASVRPSICPSSRRRRRPARNLAGSGTVPARRVPGLQTAVRGRTTPERRHVRRGDGPRAGRTLRAGGAENASTGKRMYRKRKYETAHFARMENACTENASTENASTMQTFSQIKKSLVLHKLVWLAAWRSG